MPKVVKTWAQVWEELQRGRKPAIEISEEEFSLVVNKTGGIAYYGESHQLMGGVSPALMIESDLQTGARIRVTVEVLDLGGE